MIIRALLDAVYSYLIKFVLFVKFRRRARPHHLVQLLQHSHFHPADAEFGVRQPMFPKWARKKKLKFLS